MHRLKMISALLALAFLGAGCAMAKAPVTGFIYTDAKDGIDANGSGGATKVGKSCATSILGLVGTGDASIDAAKQAGGITDVVSVDSHATSILGLYATYCLEVRGK